MLAHFLRCGAANSGRISLVGYATGTNAGTNITISLTSLTGGIDTAARTNDLVIVACASAGSGGPDFTYSASSGWTKISDLFADNTGAYQSNSSVWYKVMGGTPDTSVNVSGIDSTYIVVNGIIAYVLRGASTTNPIDVTTTTATGTGSTLANPPSITPTTSGAKIVEFGTGADDLGTVTLGQSSGYGNMVRIARTQFGMLVASKNWASGAEDPGAMTSSYSTASGAWSAATIAVRPA